MSEILSERVHLKDLQKFEKIYQEQQYRNEITPQAQFEYAWCLVRSKYFADILRGIILLEELYKSSETGQRDYLYYLALGNAKIKEYSRALGFCRSFLTIEPGNQQMVELETVIKHKMKQEFLVGVTITGAFVLALGVVLGIAITIVSKVKS